MCCEGPGQLSDSSQLPDLIRTKISCAVSNKISQYLYCIKSLKVKTRFRSKKTRTNLGDFAFTQWAAAFIYCKQFIKIVTVFVIIS